jgi:hypothetical protein
MQPYQYHMIKHCIPPLTVAEDTSHHARLHDIDLALDQCEDGDQQFDGITTGSSAPVTDTTAYLLDPMQASDSPEARVE